MPDFQRENGFFNGLREHQNQSERDGSRIKEPGVVEELYRGFLVEAIWIPAT